MNTISRIISGIISVILGLYIIFDVIWDKPEGWLWSLISGIFLIIVGIFIFFNKKEDNIEEIKSRKN